MEFKKAEVCHSSYKTNCCWGKNVCFVNAGIEIHVHIVNTNSLFPKNSTSLQSLSQVTARDQNVGSNGQIDYRIKRERGAQTFFEINSKTGEVTTSFDFDREMKQMYQIVITGVDGGASAPNSDRREGFCQVDIQITDINDHSPLFDMRGGYTLSVAENVAIGSSVLQV